ncbi:hypothetical protein ABVK25_008435 [Lepraria finkii]|uniref:Uncharacterized protein n=1 Tax=Lepraria finkii TaxID=1340010 RepID=A0ABR4B6H8_9LECA
MKYFQETKEPIDEVGKLLHELPRLDQLCLSFQTHVYDITTTEYLLQEILKMRGTTNARCFYIYGHLGGQLEETSILFWSPAESSWYENNGGVPSTIRYG